MRFSRFSLYRKSAADHRRRVFRMPGVISIADTQVRETASLLALARRVKLVLGWRCSDTAARRRVADMLNPNQPERHFPAECLEDVLLVTGRDDFLRELLAVWARVEMLKRDEAELYADARKPRTVRRRREEGVA